MNNKITNCDDFVSFIKTARYDQHLSQRKLGELCGLKQQYIYEIEARHVVPNLETVFKIVTALGFDIKLLNAVK